MPPSSTWFDPNKHCLKKQLKRPTKDGRKCKLNKAGKKAAAAAAAAKAKRNTANKKKKVSVKKAKAAASGKKKKKKGSCGKLRGPKKPCPKGTKRLKNPVCKNGKRRFCSRSKKAKGKGKGKK